MRVKTNTDVRSRVKLKLHQTLPWFALGTWGFLCGIFGIVSPGIVRFIASANPFLGISFDPGGKSGIYFPADLIENQKYLWWGILSVGTLMIVFYASNCFSRQKNN